MRVTIVTGPPCAGKSTHVDDHRAPGDVVLDLDRLAHALGYPGEHVDWSEPVMHPARLVAITARASVLKRLHALPGDGTAWVIATRGERLLDAQHRVTIDPGPLLCHTRATELGRTWAHEQIDAWYAARPTSRDW